MIQRFEDTKVKDTTSNLGGVNIAIREWKAFCLLDYFPVNVGQMPDVK